MLDFGQIVFFLFIGFVLLQLCYYVCVFSKFAFYRVGDKKVDKFPAVSVIICAKDEAENLKTFLPSIYSQEYDNFEVVLINDRSLDHTDEVMESYAEKYAGKTKLVNVAMSNNNRFIGNKKYALTLGIKAAKYNHLLFTDADCKPVSKNWIHSMSQSFDSKTKLVLGYGKYSRLKHSFLNMLIRFETLQTALQYFSYALKGMPYMGVGRNLAYTKELFMNNNGFYEHLDILSGDDDLFVNQVADEENTGICIDKDSFTVSNPKTTWAAFIHQKRRHISTSSHYKWKHKFLLALYYFSLIGFWATSIWLFIKLFNWKIVLALFLIRWIVWWIINYKTARKLDESGLVLFLPVLELALISFQFLIFVMNLIKKPKYWTV